MTRTSSNIASAAREKSGPLTDLSLTLPIFLGYHLGVVFLPMRNAADLVTRELVALAGNNLAAYGVLTVAIGVFYVGTLLLLGRDHAFKPQRFLMIAAEGIVYAIFMRLFAAYVVGELFLGPTTLTPFAGTVMSFGAGFYEEVAFRVGLFGLGARLLWVLFPMPVPFKRKLFRVLWALIAAGVFSAWHYVGALGDPFELRSFVFRWVCGLVFTAIYVFRGFAPAVWTHALYDVWVLVL